MCEQGALLCDHSTNTSRQIKGGKIKAYGVTTKPRLGSLPQIPTMNEAGLPSFEVAVWHGLYAPKDSTKPVIDTINKARKIAFKDPNVKQRCADLGSQPDPESRLTPGTHPSHTKEVHYQ